MSDPRREALEAAQQRQQRIDQALERINRNVEQIEHRQQQRPATNDLAGWLLEQIADDERVAREAKPGPWFANGDDELPEWDWQVGTATDVIGYSETFPGVDARGDVVGVGYEGGGTDRPNARHIARWDPVRVLAECEAKRRVVELHKPYRRIHGVGCEACLQPRRLPPDAPGWPCDTLRLLALPYADRPGYRAEWKP